MIIRCPKLLHPGPERGIERLQRVVAFDMGASEQLADAIDHVIVVDVVDEKPVMRSDPAGALNHAVISRSK